MDGKVLVVGYYRWGEESSSCCVQIHSSFSVATIPQVIRYRVCAVHGRGVYRTVGNVCLQQSSPLFDEDFFFVHLRVTNSRPKMQVHTQCPCVDFVANAKGWVEDEFELESNHNNNSSNSTTQIQTNTHSEQQQSICIQSTRPHGCCRRIHYLLSRRSIRVRNRSGERKLHTNSKSYPSTFLELIFVLFLCYICS